MESFAVTCPLAPDTSHLRSGSCTSPRVFGSGFLQTPPRDDALAFLLAFGSATTWQEDFHLSSSVPCPAHTPQPAYLRIEASHLPLRLPSLHQCRLTLSIGTHAARMHAWAVAERRRLRELAAQSLLAPLMNQLDKIGEEAFVLGFRNSLRSLGAHRSSAVFANMVPLLLDGWIESVRQDRTEGAIKTKR